LFELFFDNFLSGKCWIFLLSHIPCLGPGDNMLIDDLKGLVVYHNKATAQVVETINHRLLCEGKAL
jgi:hypothetical protein